MPRSKNPNPRQVTEEEKIKQQKNGLNGGDAFVTSESTAGDCSPLQVCEDDVDEMKIDHGESSPTQPVAHTETCRKKDSAKRESLARLTATKFSAVYEANPNSDNDATHDDNADVIRNVNDPEARTSLDFSPSSPPSFFVISGQSLRAKSPKQPPPLKKMVLSAKTFRTGSPEEFVNKTSSPRPSAMLHPLVMHWMRERFELKNGAKISASGIIEIYNEDMKKISNGDNIPTLQNYQVGQLLRRIFPSIKRCKITVDGKRVWVYRHLSVVERPELEQEQSGSPESGNQGESNLDEIDNPYSMYDSPASFVGPEESNGIEEDVDSCSHSLSVDVELKDFSHNRDKNNAILLGLLGQRDQDKNVTQPAFKWHESTYPSNKDNSYTEETELNPVTQLPFKKKRDSEVVEWLHSNYKFKTGFFVKSMDLLRRYNDGREELVKYLSQVGRVMKHVFPGVRHLRKSFRGGKREWVYLNLKPIDVDSDSEEGKQMQMLTMRRTARSTKFDVTPEGSDVSESREESNWKLQRVNISHMPLSLVHNRNSIFKQPSSEYCSVSRVDGTKLIINRNSLKVASNNAADLFRDGLSQDTHSKKFFASQTDHKESSEIGADSTVDDRNVSSTQITCYSKGSGLDKSENTYQISCDLERDIFTKFIKKSCHQNAENSPFVLVKSEPTEITDSQWASKKLRLCATETGKIKDDDDDDDASGGSSPVGLDLCIKQEELSNKQDRGSDSDNGTVVQSSGSGEKESGQDTDLNIKLEKTDEALNLSKKSQTDETCSKITTSFTPLSHRSSQVKMQTIHYKPLNAQMSMKQTPLNSAASSPLLTLMSARSHSEHDWESEGKENISRSSDPSIPRLAQKRSFSVMNGREAEPICWNSLENFSATEYGWIRSPSMKWTSSKGSSDGVKKITRFVEWFLFSGQWLVNRQRALREIKIYEDWSVVIHALGRRVYPNELSGITDLEKTKESLQKVFRVLAEAKICMGFPAPTVSDLYIHGILVSKFEVWSSREDSGEDIRQRAVNCQVLYSSADACCNKCSRIFKLHQQQKRANTGKHGNSEGRGSS